MNLYLLTQDTNTGYDTYDSAVVAAESPRAARLIHPSKYNRDWPATMTFNTWADTIEQVGVKLIGTAASKIPSGLILSSFNAG